MDRQGKLRLLLKNKRIQYGETKKQQAQRIGFSYSYLINITRGVQEMSENFIDRFLVAYSFTEEELSSIKDEVTDNSKEFEEVDLSKLNDSNLAFIIKDLKIKLDKCYYELGKREAERISKEWR